MDKAKKAKLAELRKKKLEQKQLTELQRHQDLVDAFNGLRDLFVTQNKESIRVTSQLLVKLDKLGSFKPELNAVKEAIENLPTVDNIKISNLHELASLQKEVDLTEVKEAINDLSESIAKQAMDSVSITNRKPEEYIPFRRVIQQNGKLIFDDDPMHVNVLGGGGGGRSFVQKELTRNGDSIAVVNPDGTPLSGGGSGASYQVFNDKVTDSDLIYIGKSLPGSGEDSSAWQIKRYQKSTGKLTFASNDATFTHRWDQRTGYDY